MMSKSKGFKVSASNTKDCAGFMATSVTLKYCYVSGCKSAISYSVPGF